MRALLLPIAGLLLAGCGTMSNGRRWGEDVTLLPGWDRLGTAVTDAATNAWTWVPLAGAGVVAVAGWDDNISSWAQKHAPIFGDPTSAGDASSTLRGVGQIAWITSLIATPSGDDPLDWTGDKLKGFAVEWTAESLTNWSTQWLKSAFPRERPDGSGLGSFPSSGASETMSFTTLAKLNLEATPMSSGVRTPMEIGLDGVAVAEAWSRIEAGKHHPTDVMVGLSLGNFVTRFVHDAFMGLPQDMGLSAYVDPNGGTFVLGFSCRF